MGYHLREITKGRLGEFSKIREEFEELSDAMEQDAKILVLCELADLVGAIAAFVKQEFKGSIGFEDVILMTQMTRDAFEEGERGVDDAFRRELIQRFPFLRNNLDLTGAEFAGLVATTFEQREQQKVENLTKTHQSHLNAINNHWFDTLKEYVPGLGLIPTPTVTDIGKHIQSLFETKGTS